MDEIPEVIRFPPNHYINRFGPTFSVIEGGEYWKASNGRRRAWSTKYAAEEALRLESCPRCYSRPAVGKDPTWCPEED
jgi:hypothetical protein